MADQAFNRQIQLGFHLEGDGLLFFQLVTGFNHSPPTPPPPPDGWLFTLARTRPISPLNVSIFTSFASWRKCEKRMNILAGAGCWCWWCWCWSGAAPPLHPSGAIAASQDPSQNQSGQLLPKNKWSLEAFHCNKDKKKCPVPFILCKVSGWTRAAV